MENKKDIGKAFREKLDGLQKSPSNAVWDSIRADLPKKRNRFLFLFWSNATQVTKTLMIAALLALVTTASYFIYDNYTDTNNPDVNNSKNNNASGTYDNSNASSGDNNNNTENTPTDNNSSSDASNTDTDSNTNAANTNGNNSNNASTISGSGNSNTNNSGRAASSKNKNNNGVAGSDGAASDNNNANKRGTSKNNRKGNAFSNRSDNANSEGTAPAKASSNNRNRSKTTKSNSSLVNAKNGADDSSTGTSTANNRNTKTRKTGRKTNTPDTNPANNNGGALTANADTSKGNNAKGKNGNNNSGNAKSGNALSSTSQGKTGVVSGTPANLNGTGTSNNNTGIGNTDSNHNNSNTNNTSTAQNNEGATTVSDSLNNALKNGGIALKDSIAPAIDSLAIAMAKDSATLCEPTIDDAKKADSTATAPYKKWYVFAHAAPTKYSLPGNSSLIDPTLNGNATTLSSSFNYGIYAGYNFSPKLSVRLGIIKAGLEQTTKNAGLFSSYSVVPGNNAEPNGYVELQLPENYSGINYRSGVSNAGVMQQLRTQADTVTVNIRHKLELYEVPIEATYTLFGKKVGVSITAGASGIFVKQNTVYAQNAQGSVLLGSLKGINKVSFSGNVGLSFYYRFMPALQVNVEPVFKYYFNTFDAIKPTSVGLQIGLQYNFDIGKQKK